MYATHLSRPPSLGRMAVGRDNNFNLLRMAGAIVVLVAHAYNILSGRITSDHAFEQAVYSAGLLALNLFFIFSGFLIASSLERNSNLIRFACARVLRLTPALLFASLFCVLIIGPMATTSTAKDYFFSWATWIYVPITTITTHPDLTLPNVFHEAPVFDAVNRPIWTLRYELVLYLCWAIFSGIGLFYRNKLYLFMSAIFIGAYFAISTATEMRSDVAAIDHMLHFGLSFLIGTLYWKLRARIYLTIYLALILTISAYALRNTFAAEVSAIVAVGYVYLYLAYIPSMDWVRRYNSLGDYSYGLYVFHWPIAQLLHQYYPDMGAPALASLTGALALPMAVLSWHIVEAPALGSIKPVSKRIERYFHRASIQARYEKPQTL